jgi:hypothetical protein
MWPLAPPLSAAPRLPSPPLPSTHYWHHHCCWNHYCGHHHYCWHHFWHQHCWLRPAAPVGGTYMALGTASIGSAAIVITTTAINPLLAPPLLLEPLLRAPPTTAGTTSGTTNCCCWHHHYCWHLLELAASPSIGNGASPLSDGRPLSPYVGGAPEGRRRG